MNGGPALTQVAVIAASCCVVHICMVGGGGGNIIYTVQVAIYTTNLNYIIYLD